MTFDFYFKCFIGLIFECFPNVEIKHLFCFSLSCLFLDTHCCGHLSENKKPEKKAVELRAAVHACTRALQDETIEAVGLGGALQHSLPWVSTGC